jgi:hypothetical protein
MHVRHVWLCRDASGFEIKTFVFSRPDYIQSASFSAEVSTLKNNLHAVIYVRRREFVYPRML